MADAMEKKRAPVNQQHSRHGTQSGPHEQAQNGQLGNQSDQTGQKEDGQGTEDEEESLNRERRAS